MSEFWSDPTRAAQRFRQTDLCKAIKAAQQAGLPVGRVEISQDGRIIIVAARVGSDQNSDTEVNEWDDVQ